MKSIVDSIIGLSEQVVQLSKSIVEMKADQCGAGTSLNQFTDISRTLSELY